MQNTCCLCVWTGRKTNEHKKTKTETKQRTNLARGYSSGSFSPQIEIKITEAEEIKVTIPRRWNEETVKLQDSRKIVVQETQIQVALPVSQETQKNEISLQISSTPQEIKVSQQVPCFSVYSICRSGGVSEQCFVEHRGFCTKFSHSSCIRKSPSRRRRSRSRSASPGKLKKKKAKRTSRSRSRTRRSRSKSKSSKHKYVCCNETHSALYHSIEKCVRKVSLSCLSVH